MSQTLAQLRSSPDLRPVRWGVAVLLVVQVAGLQLWAWKESATLKARQAQVSQLLTRTFPTVTVVIDPPLQMAREVTALRTSLGAAGAGDLETMLGAVASQGAAGNGGAGLAGLSGTPTRIDFATGELRLTGLTLPAAQAAPVEQALRQAGYRLQQEASVLRLTPLAATDTGPDTGSARPGTGAKP
jgi:general secretion pathway protein L